MGGFSGCGHCGGAQPPVPRHGFGEHSRTHLPCRWAEAEPGSSAWTNEKSEQDRFVRDIEAGMTATNQMLASAPEAPFGGMKRSGHGRELSRYGLHEFMNRKTVMIPAAC